MNYDPAGAQMKGAEQEGMVWHEAGRAFPFLRVYGLLPSLFTVGSTSFITPCGKAIMAS